MKSDIKTLRAPPVYVSEARKNRTDMCVTNIARDAQITDANTLF
jgi:hypothetical protein